MQRTSESDPNPAPPPAGLPGRCPWEAVLPDSRSDRRAFWFALCGVLAFWWWSAWPLLLWTDELAFAGKLTTDNVVSAWFYDYASRTVRSGGDLFLLTQLNHPRPYETAVEFPAVLDAVLAAPLGWLLGWPRQWGAAQALALLVNGLGGAVLARGLGARGVGVFVAGALAVVCRPVWKDLVMARMNAVWPGFSAAALALVLLGLRASSPGRAALAAAGAAVLGAVAAALYPPGLLLFAPLGAVLVLDALVQAPWKRSWVLLVAVGGGLALALPELRRILATRSGEAGLGELGCPDRWASLNAVDLVRLRPNGSQGLSEPALPLTAWVAAPLALLAPRRLATAGVLGLVALWFLLSLGPCSEWAEGQAWDVSALPGVGPLAREAWRFAGPLHDFSRFAGVATLLSGVLLGVGRDALGRGSGGRGIGAALLGCALLGHVQWVVLSERLSPTKWHDAAPPATADFLAALPAADRGPAAELPFDRKRQFLSLIGAPEPPRLNPLRPGDNPPVRQPVVEWVYALGFGRLRDLPEDPPLDPTWVRWVFFDANRCTGGGVRPSACGIEVEAALRETLGEPRSLDDGTQVWSVGPWSAAAAALTEGP